jgi:disease resistance protein RPM1
LLPNIPYVRSNIYLANIPKWISRGFTSLAIVNINLTELSEEAMHTLGELPSLVVLDLFLYTRPKEKLSGLDYSHV